MNSEINFNAILMHLSNYAGAKYTRPDKTTDEMKPEILARKKSGGEAADELHKLALLFAETYQLVSSSKSKWLDGANTSVRHYLWSQLKDKKYTTYPSSISIFAEKINQQVQFCIAVELDQKNATAEDINRHHRLLDYRLTEDAHYSYKITTALNVDFINHEETVEEIKEKLRTKEYKKVQLVYILTLSDIEERQLSNEDILRELTTAFQYLKDCYQYILQDIKPSGNDQNTTKKIGVLQPMHSKNTILYGPPGTGKTFNTILHAVSIIDGKPLNTLQNEPYETVLERYNTLKRNNRIVFTTFHQSYGYEEFIEGIKPTLEDDQTQIEYQIQSGIFKEFCETAQEVDIVSEHMHVKSSAQVWKVSLGGSGTNDVKRDCFEHDRIRIGWDHFGEAYLDGSKEPEGNTKNILNDFYNEMKIGDLIFSLKDQKHIDAIGVIVGDPEWLDSEKDYITDKKNNLVTHYKRSRKVEWVAKNINENIFELNKRKNLTLNTVYKLKRISVNDAQELLQKYLPQQAEPVSKNQEPYVFIIDEINRGNISKILGELITLIEPSKRIGAAEEMTVQLPYSKSEFGVPDNVFILGTMNTADRSIALMDTALRRRFQFIEMMPDAQVLSGITVDSINVKEMLSVINQRIEVLYDREHMLGHAYFVPLKSNPTLETLSNIFINAIIPLLQEYFYEDYSKIQMILGDNAKADHLKFIRESEISIQNIFKGTPEIDLPEMKYTLQLSAFSNPESYKEIYE